MPKRAAPWMFWAGYLLTVLWVALTRASMGQPSRVSLLRPFYWSAGVIVANLIAAGYAVRIQRDYPKGSGMRAAWILIAAGAACGALRYVVLLVVPGARSVGAMSIAEAVRSASPGGLTGLLALGSMLCLIAGFALMWFSYRRLIGFHFPWTDGLMVGGILALTVSLFVLRELVPSTVVGPPTVIIRRLQLFDPLTVAWCGFAAIGMRRVAQEIRGGALAASVNCIVALACVRLAAILVRVSPWGGRPWVVVPITAVSLGSDWLIALVVFYRWRVTETAARLERQYRVPTASQVSK